MELRHLRYFVAVAEEMNIHRAAKRLNISQPPLSLSIQQLEEDIGVVLFTREGRGIQITRAGEIYLARARQILADTERAAAEAKDSSLGITGTLKIGFIGSSVTGILQKTVSAYKAKYPFVALDIELTTSHGAPVKVLEKKFDVAIIRLPENLPAGLEVKAMPKEFWVAAVPERHPLAAQKAITIKELGQEKLIFYPRDNSPASYDDVMQIFHEHKITPHIYQETNEQIAIAGLVASNMGIGIVPECMASIKILGVVHRPLKGVKKRTGFAFIYRPEKDILVKNFFQAALA